MAKILVKTLTKKKATAVKDKPKAETKKPKVELKGLTPRQLIKMAPDYIRNNAYGVYFEEIKRKRTKDDKPGILAKALAVTGKPRSGTYRVTVTGKHSELELSEKNQKVVVSCACDFHKYTCEYALYHNGASFIKYSNGEPATTTNPGNYPVICKHSYALLEKILEKGW